MLMNHEEDTHKVFKPVPTAVVSQMCINIGIIVISLKDELVNPVTSKP